MIAESANAVGACWRPDPWRQRLADHTVEDLLKLPDDAGRVELVDGVIQVLPLPNLGHQEISCLLCAFLHVHTPAHLAATQAVNVALDLRSTRRPDVLLIRAEIDRGRSLLTPDDVILAVEVESPGTERIDRLLKLADYAAAEIRHYWRVEQNPVHVFAYQRANRPGADGWPKYELVADSADVLELAEPFAIKLPISEITP